MLTVQEIIENTLDHEGGFVDDPDDPGGATNFGITLGALRRVGRDLDGDGIVGVADIRRLTRKIAAEILRERYFDAPGIGRLPECLQPTVFDMQVNAGRQAIRLLQRLLCRMGEPVAVDGVIGPQTAAAAHRAARRSAKTLSDAYGIERRNYYYRLADRRPRLRKFARRRDGGKGGWIRRAETFISPVYHLTEDQHRERTSAWD